MIQSDTALRGFLTLCWPSPRPEITDPFWFWNYPLGGDSFGIGRHFLCQILAAPCSAMTSPRGLLCPPRWLLCDHKKRRRCYQYLAVKMASKPMLSPPSGQLLEPEYPALEALFTQYANMNLQNEVFHSGIRPCAQLFTIYW
jgi:hypothetical protein